MKNATIFIFTFAAISVLINLVTAFVATTTSVECSVEAPATESAQSNDTGSEDTGAPEDVHTSAQPDAGSPDTADRTIIVE